jgi:glycosyltransferase involved in cell wall biosynthesis
MPVYNTPEKYLREAIVSAVNQDFMNFEVILVDDGSTDKSGDICDQYKDYNVKIIHKKNGGKNSARQLGVKTASGKYICFMDSDDLVEPNYISELYRVLVENNSEIAWCSFDSYDLKGFRKTEATKYGRFKYLKITTGEEMIEHFLFGKTSVHTPRIAHNVYGTLASKKFWETINWDFCNIRVGQDYLELLLMISNTLYFNNMKNKKNKNFGVVYNKVLYHYRQRKGSTMTNMGKSVKKIVDDALNLGNKRNQLYKKIIDQNPTLPKDLPKRADQNYILNLLFRFCDLVDSGVEYQRLYICFNELLKERLKNNQIITLGFPSGFTFALLVLKFGGIRLFKISWILARLLKIVHPSMSNEKYLFD